MDSMLAFLEEWKEFQTWKLAFADKLMQFKESVAMRITCVI